MKILFPLPLYLTALLSAGCGNMMKSNYQEPQVTYPANWLNHLEPTTSALIDGHNSETSSLDGWLQQIIAGGYGMNATLPFTWLDFNDPQLDRWLQQVMASNNDLATAILRVYRARLDAEQIGSNNPSFSATLNADRNTALSDSLPWASSSSANLNIDYEPDLWGKIARQRDAAEWARQASEQDLQEFRLTLLSEASNNYWYLGFLNQQIDVSQQSIVYARKTLQLANARFHAGSISALDVVNAEQSLLNQENRLLELQHERKQALNVQAVLLGAPPGNEVAEPTRLPTQPLPQINSGIPARILGNRPDIRAKELRLRAALANVDIKRAEYYPAFNLTGSLGTSSTALLKFLRNPVGSVGASLALPFLQWRQINLDIKMARNDYEQLVLEFKQSLYKAMASVDDALSLRAQLIVQETHLRTMLALAYKSERLNEVRYRQGAVANIDWLDAQEQRRQAELALDENRLSQYQNLVKIYLEFGGVGAWTG